MRTFLVANPKGGCGKSTMAVHLASWFAGFDTVVYLGDLDRQQSSCHWLASRPLTLPLIRNWPLPEGELSKPPVGCDLAILDSPAGIHGKRLKNLLSEVDRVIVPVSPSCFDMLASREFFEELAEAKAVRKEKVGIAVVGMRVDRRTHSTQKMIEFLEGYDFPLLTCIRSSERYVQTLDTGRTLFDHARPDSSHFEDWKPLLDWLINRRAGS